MIIGITGAVSVGKTTLSKKFSKTYNYYCISLKELAEKNSLLEEYDEETDSYLIDLDCLKRTLNEELNIISTKTDKIIVESHLLVEGSFPLDKLLILRNSPLLLFERMLKRGYSKKKAYENALLEALDYFPVTANYYYDEENIYEINLLNLNEEDSVNLIKKAVNGEIPKKTYSFKEDLEKLALMKL